MQSKPLNLFFPINVPNVGQKVVNLFHVTDLFQYSLKTSENQKFSVFRGYWKKPVAWKVVNAFSSDHFKSFTVLLKKSSSTGTSHGYFLMGISNRLRTIAEESVKDNYCLLEIVISHSLMEQQDAPFSKIQRLEQHLQGNPYSPSAKGCSD